MFDKRSTESEIVDDLTLDHVDLVRNLHEIEMTNRWFGSSNTFVNALDRIYKKIRPTSQQPIVLADLGCGSGDLLRLAHNWSKTKKAKFNIIGYEANPNIVEQAQALSKHYPSISYQQKDIFCKDFADLRFDIVTMSSFCHHLQDEQLIKLLQQLRSQTKVAIVINDLHRHWLPYLTIKLVTKLLNFTTLARHDGPTSVLRGFQKSDFIHILESANISHYTLQWSWAFRWQLIIWCDSN